MIRAIIISLTLALSACTTVPTTPIKASGQAGVAGFATLAIWGEWESELAPAYTQIAATRHRAARLLAAGRIDVATAVAVQSTADKARALLDQSRRGDAKQPTLLQRAQLDEAQRLIGTAESLLEQ